MDDWFLRVAQSHALKRQCSSRFKIVKASKSSVGSCVGYIPLMKIEIFANIWRNWEGDEKERCEDREIRNASIGYFAIRTIVYLLRSLCGSSERNIFTMKLNGELTTWMSTRSVHIAEQPRLHDRHSTSKGGRSRRARCADPRELTMHNAAPLSGLSYRQLCISNSPQRASLAEFRRGCGNINRPLYF